MHMHTLFNLVYTLNWCLCKRKDQNEMPYNVVFRQGHQNLHCIVLKLLVKQDKMND